MFKRKKIKASDIGALRQIAEVYAYMQERLGYESGTVFTAGIEWAKKHQRKKKNVTQVQLLRELEAIIAEIR